MRRSRRLVVSFVATVGNYEYGFFWYFYLDGNIQLEVKLTGIVSPMAIEPGTQPEFANVIGEGVAAPHHQHMFNARLDFDVDGPVNEVYEVDAERMPPGPDNPWRNAFRQRSDAARHRAAAQRDTDAASSRAWRIVNPEVRNGLGQNRRLQAGADDVDADAARAPRLVGRQAGRVRAAQPLGHAVRAATSGAAAGEYPNQHAGGDGLPAWTARDRSIAGTDIVCWYSFGVTHFVRPEDWPVMPVEYTGFLLAPFGFFDRNPALDVPRDPTTATTERSRLMGNGPAKSCKRARQLRRDRAGGGPHRRLAAVGRAVHRGRAVRRAPLRHVRRARSDPRLDLRDDGGVAELRDEGVPARLVRVRRGTRLVDLPDREPLPSIPATARSTRRTTSPC